MFGVRSPEDIKNEILDRYGKQQNQRSTSQETANATSSTQPSDGRETRVETEDGISGGRKVSESVSQGEHREVTSISGRTEETSHRLGERIQSASRNLPNGSQQERRESENRVTREFAQENGLWIPFSDIDKLGRPFLSGDEHNNYIDEENQVIYKVNNRMHTPSILELLDRMEQHNKLFPNTKYTLVGFTSLGEKGDVMPVFSQRFVSDSRAATEDEITSYMNTLGFDSLGNGRYSNGEIIVKDLKPRNVLVNANNDVYVVDAEFEPNKNKANLQELKESTEAFVKAMGGKGVHVVNDENELPQSEDMAYRAIKSGEKVMGWYNLANNQVYIYTPNANDEQEVFETLLHEFVAHKGLRDLMGHRNFDNMCKNVWSMMDSNRRLQFALYVKESLAIGSTGMLERINAMSEQEKKDYLDELSDRDCLAAADEFIAHFAEYGVSEEERNIWQNIVDTIRQWLRDVGFIVGISEREIAQLLAESHNRLTRNMTIGEMAEAVMRSKNIHARLIKEGDAMGFDREGITYKSKDGKTIRYKQLSLFNGTTITDNDGSGANNVRRSRTTTLSTLNHLRELEDGEICYVEHQFTESGEFDFMTGNKIESCEDVAYIFKNLENEAIENTFGVLIKNGKPTILHLGMGHHSSSVIDFSSLIVAVNRIDPDRVVFVHNHPSGKLICSPQDKQAYSNLEKAIGEKMEDGIIINTRSGEFVTFNQYGLTYSNVIPTNKEGKKAKVYKFNKQSFKVDAPAKFEFSSYGIAEFISTQRLGARDKLNVLLMNHAGECVGNVFLTDNQITASNAGHVAQQIVHDALSMGGYNVALYGRSESLNVSAHGTNIVNNLSDIIRQASSNMVRLVDVIEILNDGYESANDNNIRFRISEEEQGIIDKAKADGTYMKAPNGKKTKLTEKQWAQVRTKAFKRWFGDWEKATRIEKLRESKPVEMNGEEHIGKYELNRESAQSYILNNLRGNYVIADTNEQVELVKKGAKKVTSHSMGNDVHVKSIALIPKIIQSSIFVEEMPSEKDDSQYDSYRYYVCGLDYNGESYTVKVTIGVKGGDYYYDHSLTEVEKGKLLDMIESNQAVSRKGFTPTGDAPIPSYALSRVKDTKLLSILQTNSSKIVDENGEPMVVYHDTNATELVNIETGENWNDIDWRAKDEWRNREDFDDYWEERDFYTFNDLRSRRSIEMPAYFFSTKEDEYHEYGNRTIRAFLNITKPAIDPSIDNAGVYDTAGEDAMGKLIAQGYDGFIRTNDNGEWYEVNAFYPNQIKSAETVTYDDNGNVIPLSERFNDDKSDIRFRIANENQRIFVSNAERAVEGIKQEKATPQQWKAMIEKQGGLKAGEDKWLGLSDWLEEKANATIEMTNDETIAEYAKRVARAKTLTKQEILDFIDENKIQIEEVKYTQFGYGLIDEATRKLEAELKEIGWGAMVEKYPGFDELFEVYNGELLWSEERASVGEYEDFIIDEKIVDLDSQDNAINETREKYTTEGLERKREVALVAPTIEPWNKNDEVHFGDAGGGRAIAWIRFGETTDEDGNRVLVIDEIQSKRHQEGREKGYKREFTKEEEAEYKDLTEEYQRISVPLKMKYGNYIIGKFRTRPFSDFSEEEIKQLVRAENILSRLYELESVKIEGIPSAPFDKNWHELAMKRMLRYAAENGYDYVAWTTGEQQAERYDIGKVVNRIESNDTVDYDSTLGVDLVKQVVLFTRDGNAITLRLTPEGIVRASSQYNGHHISDIVGKELGNRIMTETDLVLKEQDLRIGGEGMKGFYDKMLPSFVSKYTKKWGAKVEDIELPKLEKSAQTMHAVNVTPEMKKSVMEGQVMFSIVHPANFIRDDSTLEEDKKFIDIVSAKTGIDFRKSVNSNSWYGMKDGKIIRISNHFNKKTNQEKYYFDQSPEYIAAKINGENPFASFKEGDKIVHSASKIGEVEFVSYDDKNGFVEVRLADGSIHKYDEVKFSIPANFEKDTNVSTVNDRFNEELQQQIDGTLPKGHIYQLGMPSGILQACGFPDMPIELSSTNLAEHARKTRHPFELKDVMDLVIALQEPIGVFTYGDKEKSQNVIVEIQKEGRNFLVGVHFNQNRRGLVVSDIRGIFPKDNAEWLNWINQGKSLYLDKEKIQDLIDKQRKTLAEVAYLDLDSVANIVNDFENPKLSEENGIRFRTTYHGSASDFAKFDHSFMGTGEGLQSFGWGTYVTEVEDVAKRYANVALKGERKFKYIGDKDVKKSIVEDAEGLIDNAGGFDEALQMYEGHRLPPHYPLAIAFDFIRSTSKSDWEGQRHMYEVEIPDANEAYYIDYKERMSNQGEIFTMVDNALASDGWQRKEVDDKVVFSDGLNRIVLNPKQTGGDFYNELAFGFGSPQAASEYLNDVVGITGIQYDVNYHNGGNEDGAKNYVIFNADDAKVVSNTRFSILSKDAYDRKREWAARRMANNADIGQANGLTEEQTDLLEKLASLRHELHTSQDSYISGNSDILDRLVALNERMAENDIAMPFIPTDTSDYIDIDNIDILKELDWDNEIPESDTEEYQDWYDETYNRIYGELEDLNRQIESFLGGIDERYGTSYRPSGYTRFSVKTTNDRFNEELQQQIDGTLPNGHIYQLGMPGEILRSAGIPNLPIEMASQRLIHKSNQENHPFSLESVSNLPMAIQNPIAIFDSRTNRKSKVLLTELQYNGNNFVVALRLRNEGEGIDLEVNSIQSLYPKDRVGGVIEWVNTGLLRYANQKKLVDFLTQSTNLIAGKETDLNNATKIINDFENPKLSEENGTRFSIRGNAWSDVPAYNPGETIGEYIQRVNAWKLYLLHA